MGVGRWWLTEVTTMRETTNNAGPTPGPWVVFIYDRTGDDAEVLGVRLYPSEAEARAACDECDLRTDGNLDARAMPASLGFSALDLLAFVERVACFHDARPEVTVCDLENSARDLLRRLSIARTLKD